MKRVLSRLVLLVLIAASSSLFPAPARAETTAVNTTAFPLPGNVLFPARTERKAIRCQNDDANDTATITYPSLPPGSTGFSFKLKPGGALWDTNLGVPGTNIGIGPNGPILATGTAGNVLNCQETYRERFP